MRVCMRMCVSSLAASSMVKFSVGVYARLRPSRPRQVCHIRTTEDKTAEPPILRTLDFSIQRKNEGEYINNKVEQYKFSYDRVFDGTASQVCVFDVSKRSGWDG